MTAKTNAEAVAPVYKKAQLLASKKYANRQDIINVLLEDDKTYTTFQVDALIEKFMKGQVK